MTLIHAAKRVSRMEFLEPGIGRGCVIIHLHFMWHRPQPPAMVHVTWITQHNPVISTAVQNRSASHYRSLDGPIIPILSPV